MKNTNSVTLFPFCNRYKGTAKRLPAQQNERKGKIHIEVWNEFGKTLINWTGREIPASLKEEIEQMEFISDCNAYFQRVTEI